MPKASKEVFLDGERGGEDPDGGVTQFRFFFTIEVSLFNVLKIDNCPQYS